MKTREDIIKALEALEGGAELVEAFEAIETGFKAELTKKNNEAKNLRDRAKNAQELATALEAVKTKYGKTAKVLGLEEDLEDLDEALEAVQTKLLAGENATKTKGEVDTKMADLSKQINKLTKDLEAANTAAKTANDSLVQERGKRHTSMKNGALLKELTTGNAIKPAQLASMLSHSVEVDENDALLFVTDTGDRLPLKDGVTKFLKENPEFVVNTQKPGSGGKGGSGNDDPNILKVTRAQLADTEFYQKHHDKISKDEYEIIDEGGQ